MNTGIFGEGFPYSNFHELNMDWIIRIAKDFLDQYTHIQEIIANGEQSLQDLTESGLEQLQDKADTLENLLQEWYNTHSEDIADQLADALADLNSWYTTHQNYLDQTLTQKTNTFKSMADTKTQQSIASIPDDYTKLSQHVAENDGIENALSRLIADNEIHDNKLTWRNFTRGTSLGTESAGLINKWGNVVSGGTFAHVTAPVTRGNTYLISGTSFGTAFVAYVLLKNNNVVSCGKINNNPSQDQEKVFVDYPLTIREDADTLIVNGYAGYIKIYNCVMNSGISYTTELRDIHNSKAGVYSNGLTLIESGTFVHAIAKIEKGKTYAISGITMPNTDFPSYLLLKNHAVVSHIRVQETVSADTPFHNEFITISDDVDTIIVNGTSPMTWVKEVVTTEISIASEPAHDWVLQTPEVRNGVKNNTGTGINGNVGSHSVLLVRPGDKLKIIARQWNDNYSPYVFQRNGYISTYYPGGENYNMDSWYTLELTVPDDTNVIMVNGLSMNEPGIIYKWDVVSPDSIIANYKPLDNTNFWKGKKIVWFGTSIPAGGRNNYHNFPGNGAYPDRIGQMLGATVYNESFGSSCVRYGNYQFVTEDDPQGLAGMWLDNFLYSLSGSASEKQAIFDNWEYWKTIIQSGNVSGVTLTDQQKANALACSWDRKLTKYLTGGSVGQVDLYVFDHGHNDEYQGNYNTIKTIPPEGHESDRTYFIGAMRFLINKILTDNPRARICFIGHYQNDIKKGISEAQEELANIWNYPLCKTWEKIGWTQNTVTIDGVTKTLTEIWMPDNIHPSSDTTGRAIQKYAETLYPFIRDVR